MFPLSTAPEICIFQATRAYKYACCFEFFSLGSLHLHWRSRRMTVMVRAFRCWMELNQQSRGYLTRSSEHAGTPPHNVVGSKTKKGNQSTEDAASYVESPLPPYVNKYLCECLSHAPWSRYLRYPTLIGHNERKDGLYDIYWRLQDGDATRFMSRSRQADQLTDNITNLYRNKI